MIRHLYVYWANAPYWCRLRNLPGGKPFFNQEQISALPIQVIIDFCERAGLEYEGWSRELGRGTMGLELKSCQDPSLSRCNVMYM